MYIAIVLAFWKMILGSQTGISTTVSFTLDQKSGASVDRSSLGRFQEIWLGQNHVFLQSYDSRWKAKIN